MNQIDSATSNIGIIPADVWQKTIEFVGPESYPATSGVSRIFRKASMQPMEQHWKTCQARWKKNPILASYIHGLRLDDPTLNPNQKFNQLYTALKTTLTSLRCYVSQSPEAYEKFARMAETIDQVALIKTWPKIAKTIRQLEHPDLPTEETIRRHLSYPSRNLALNDRSKKILEDHQNHWIRTSANRIKSILDDPRNARMIQTVTELGIFILDTYAFPTKINRFAPTLTSLDIEGNCLTYLSPTIGEFTQLRDLNVSCNRLTTLPPELSNLSQLRILDLSSNPFSTFPDVIRTLTELEELSLRYNSLDIPSDWLSSLPENLRKLDLGGNNLMRLPPPLSLLLTIERLIETKVLQLNESQLEEFHRYRPLLPFYGPPRPPTPPESPCLIS